MEGSHTVASSSAEVQGRSQPSCLGRIPCVALQRLSEGVHFSSEFMPNPQHPHPHRCDQLMLLVRRPAGLAPRFKVYLNKCKHQGGRFAHDIEDTVVCTHHQWRLDLESGSYLHNPDITQPELPSHVDPTTGDLVVYSNEKDTQHAPWLPRMPRGDLVSGELTVTYISHACVKIKAGLLPCSARLAHRAGCEVIKPSSLTLGYVDRRF